MRQSGRKRRTSVDPISQVACVPVLLGSSSNHGDDAEDDDDDDDDDDDV